MQIMSKYEPKLSRDLKIVAKVLAVEAARMTKVYGRKSLERSHIAVIVCDLADAMPPHKAGAFHYYFGHKFKGLED